MHALSPSFVLGFHGCDREVGEAILQGNASLKLSDNDYDWLGPGVYFWEANPLRGIEWATSGHARGKINEPFVVGALINLGYCLDLMTQNAIKAVEMAYGSLRATHDRDPDLGPVPSNRGGNDRLIRHLDCAVVRHLHKIREAQRLAPFDTVRGLFQEGGPIYEGAGFQRRTHVQIAVRNPAAIVAVFRVEDRHFG